MGIPIAPLSVTFPPDPTPDLVVMGSNGELWRWDATNNRWTFAGWGGESTVVGIPEAPDDGQQYARQAVSPGVSPSWTVVDIPAPDLSAYATQAWVTGQLAAYATQAFVTTAIATAMVGKATEVWVTDQINAGLLTVTQQSLGGPFVTSAELPFPVSVAQGGTGATTAPAALTNLGALPLMGGTMVGIGTGGGSGITMSNNWNAAVGSMTLRINTSNLGEGIQVTQGATGSNSACVYLVVNGGGGAFNKGLEIVNNNILGMSQLFNISHSILSHGTGAGFHLRCYASDDATEVFSIQRNGTTTVAGPMVSNYTGTGNALTLDNTGSGNALLVQQSAGNNRFRVGSDGTVTTWRPDSSTPWYMEIIGATSATSAAIEINQTNQSSPGVPCNFLMLRNGSTNHFVFRNDGTVALSQQGRQGLQAALGIPIT
jgi:hypothetical protein